jgi:hypothetical protein
MARAKRDDRLLSKEDQHLVKQTRHPVVKELSDRDVFEVVKQLRERRALAREVGRYKRRELRGQTASFGMPVTPGSAASESEGHRAKRTLLSGALKRANKEAERRHKRRLLTNTISRSNI